MPIYLGENKKIMFKGDYRPAEFYKGGQKITGYTTTEKTGTELTAESTYNDVLLPVISGKAWQANANPTPESPSPIIVSGGSNVVIEGRNLLPNAATSQTSNGVIFTVNADKSITINGIKTNPQASSFAVLSGNFYQYQNKIINFSLDNDYVYSGGAVGVNIGARFTDGRFVPIVLGGQLRAKSFWCNNDIGCIYIEAVKSDLYNNLEVLPQLALGTTPHPYIPYHVPITMPLPEGFGGVGDISDRIYSSGGKVWWEKKTETAVFDGSEDEVWAFRKDTPCSSTRLSNFKNANFLNGALAISTIMSLGDANKINTFRLISIDGHGFQFNLDPLIFPIVDDWVNLIKSNPLTVRYELATPVLTDISDTPTGIEYLKLQTYYPFTHIYSTGQAEVKPTITAEIKQI